MDWANERYVRLYTRDTTTWKLLDWRARTVLLHLLRKVDRAGVIDVAEHGARGLAAVLDLPLAEVVSGGLEQLIAEAVVVVGDGVFVLPNFLEAQEATGSDRLRQRESRARRRAVAMSRDVTPSHAESQPVTICDTVTQSVTTEVRPSLHTSLAESNKSAPQKPALIAQDPDPSLLALSSKGDPTRERVRASARERRAERRSELPATWQPGAEHIALGAELGVDVAAEAAKFRDHAQANARLAARWGAAFNFWLRRSAEYARGNGGNGKRNGGGMTAREIWELADRLDAEDQR